jgi:hypothetical protein
MNNRDFYQRWAEGAAALLSFRDAFIPEYFEREAQKLVNEWETYPPHAAAIK